MTSRWSNRVTKHGELSRGDESLDVLPSSARTWQEEATNTPLSEKRRGGGESPHVHTLVPKSTPHRCHSQVSSPLPTQETWKGDSSFVNSAQLQKLGGSLWHISRMGGWMDNGGTAQEGQAGICWPILCCPSLQHFWAFLCALGSHHEKSTNPTGGFLVGFACFKHGAGFLRKTAKATGLNSSEEQGATSGTGPGQQSQWEGTKENNNYLSCSWTDLNPK